jgi:hypothetical protein
VITGLGLVRGMMHVIDVKLDAIPVVMPTRRLSPDELNVEEEMVRKLVSAGIWSLGVRNRVS